MPCNTLPQTDWCMCMQILCNINAGEYVLRQIALGAIKEYTTIGWEDFMQVVLMNVIIYKESSCTHN